MRVLLSRAGAVVGAAVIAIGAASAYAAGGDVRVTVKYRVTSNVVQGEQRLLTLVGTGRSAQLGFSDVTSSVVTTPGVVGCAPRTADEVWTMAGGSLEVAVDSVICANGAISGTWTVTAGSGSFAGASGAGELRGHLGGQGDRLVISYTGDLAD